MKKKLFLLFVASIIALSVFSFSCSAAEETYNLTGENVYVSTYSELKSALENASHLGRTNNITFKSNITVTDNSKDLTITIANPVNLAVDLNGYNLEVTSSATKNLFRITGQARLFFITNSVNPDVGISKGRSQITFNSSKPGSALLFADNSGVEITNINVDFYMGTANGTFATTDGSESYIFYVKNGAKLDIYKGNICNYFENGNGIGIESNSSNKTRFTMKIGGGSVLNESTVIGAKRHCVVLDPSGVKLVRFGSCFFESLNSDKGKYARILVPAASNATLASFWTSLDATTYIYVGSEPQLTLNKKITALKNADINSDKQCETLSSNTDHLLLNYSGGHVFVCGTCYSSYDQIQPHTTVTLTPKEPSCASSGRTGGFYCSVCGYSTSVTVPAKGHSMTFYPKKAATCTEKGNIAHYRCESCRLMFSDEKGVTLLKDSDVFVGGNHKLKILPRVEPTCTVSGKTEGKYCETCKKTVTAQTEIAAYGHSEVAIGTAISPTCITEGKTAGSKCSRCHTVFEEQKTLAKTNHKTETIKGSQPTCTKNGVSDKEVCTVCNTTVSGGEVLLAKGHTEKIIPGKKATCLEEGLTDGAVCTVCNTVIKNQEPVAKGAHVPKTVTGKEATCLEEGLSDGSECAVCKIVLEPQSVIPKGGHKEQTVKGKDATCFEKGLTDGKICSICEKVLLKQEPIPTLPHSERVIEAIPATCTAEGKTAGIECAFCKAVIKAPEVAPKAPHTEKVIDGKKATCTKEGKESSVVCSVCKAVLKEGAVIPKTNHNEKVIKGTAPTCLKEGTTDSIECSDCKKVIKESAPLKKLSHTVSTSTVRADLKNNGEITESCAVCKKELSKKTVYRVKTVKLSDSYYIYNGKKKNPSVAVKDSKGNNLKKGTDYTLEYSGGRKAIGTYSVKITFTGNYAGEKTLNFSVLPAKTEKIISGQTESSIKLKWQKVEGAAGYRVYLFNTKTKNYKTLVTTTKNSFTVKKLKAGTTYKFAVKAYTKSESGVLWSKLYTEFSATTLLKAPTVKATAGKNQITLSFTGANGADGYVIYLSDSKKGEYKKLTATKNNPHTLKKLKKGQRCFFKVRAYKKVDGKNVYSTYSKVVGVTVK